MSLKIKSLLTILCLASITGCASKNQSEIFDGMTASELYSAGVEFARKKHYFDAVEHFEALEARYPFGEYAEKAKLGEIYAHYKDNDWPSTLASADRFTIVYPRHPHVDYAYYMKGLAHFSESLGSISKYLPMDRAERNIQSTKEAYDTFADLVYRYPTSEYASDAQKRMVYLRNVLAANELHAARFNMDRKAYVAAANRADYIITHFDRSPIIEEALFIQVAALRKMNKEHLANDAQRVLELNFPQSEFLKELG